MSNSDSKTRILRFFWNAFPWMIVFFMLTFIAVMYVRIGGERERLAEARMAAMKEEVPSVRVITLTLVPRLLEDKINLPGLVEPFEELWVKSEVHGQVTRILVEEGQRVKKGQILVEIDDRDYRSNLVRIEAGYDLIKQEYNRIATLVKKKITSKNKLDEIEARLKDVTAQRRAAQLALSRTRVTSPINGRLNEIKPVEGDLLSVSMKVAQILDVGNVKVTVGVPESDVSAFFDLDEANVIIEALDNRRVKGKKLFLSYKPRSLARLYDLELLVPNPDNRILPGMFARVELVKKKYTDALVVPLYTVINQGDERFVFIENDGKAKRRPVELGILAGWQVQITSGLNADEKVIVVGHRLLSDGHSVKVIKNVQNAREILIP